MTALVHLAVAAWEDRCGPRRPGDRKGASTFYRSMVTCPDCLEGLPEFKAEL